MKKITVCLFVGALMLLFSVHVYAAKPTTVEVLYMNHGPLEDTLHTMKNLFSKYGDKLTISWYDFDSKTGEQFMAKKGITQHAPLLVWVDGSTAVKLGQKEVKFSGFPTGSGPASFQGKWTFDDLKMALDETVGKKK
jgi:hypothetical protein